MPHKVTYAQAIAEATNQAMEMDDSVFVIGQGTRDRGQIFGSMEGVFQKFGEGRVVEMPIAESAMAGVCVGAALSGLRPVLVLQRADFAFLTLDQMINHAAKYYFMFGGQTKVPLTMRLIVGKGWGQGPQHSQSLHSMFAHFPGLRVVAPTDAFTAKGILLNSIFSDDPTIIIEARPLYSSSQEVPEKPYIVPFGRANVLAGGTDITIAAVSFMVPEAIKAAGELMKDNISTEVIDVISINPLDIKTIAASVAKTGRLLILDSSWSFCGISAEISAQVNECLFGDLKAPVRRLTIPFSSTPTAAELEKRFYPDSNAIIKICRSLIAEGVKSNV